MTERWVIHQGNQVLGPWTAAEIRQYLRDGRVNPFDLVSPEGSQVRYELIGVDAIFKDGETDSPTFAGSDDGNIAREFDQGVHQTELSSGVSGFDESLPVTDPSATPMGEEEAEDTVVSGKAANQADPPRSGRRQRYYYLRDKKQRELGPLAAKEIQSLYYRGILDRSVRVLKRPGGKGMSIGQFMSRYGGAKAANFQSHHHRLDLGGAGGTSTGLPNSRVMDELAQIHRHRNAFRSASVGWLAMAAVGLGALLAWGWIQLGAGQRWSAWVADMKEPASVAQRVSPPAPKVAAKSAPKAVKPTPRPAKPARTIAKKSIKTIPKALPKGRMKAPRQIPKRAPASFSKPTPRRVKKRAVSQKTSVPSSGVMNLARKVGQVVTVGPLRFSMSSVAKCEGSCEVIFKDNSGLSVRGRFFKGAYEDELRKAGGRATISGLVAKQSSGYVIYLQSVR